MLTIFQVGSYLAYVESSHGVWVCIERQLPIQYSGHADTIQKASILSGYVLESRRMLRHWSPASDCALCFPPVQFSLPDGGEQQSPYLSHSLSHRHTASASSASSHELGQL